MTQVGLGLTTVSGLTQLIRSLALMMLIKNLRRHSTPEHGLFDAWQRGHGARARDTECGDADCWHDFYSI
jgi:hypothetical protein